MNDVNIYIPYMDSVFSFAKIVMLAAILSLFCTSLTEIFKNLLASRLAEKNSSCMIALSGLISMAVGILWPFCFARQDISLSDSVWLGLILWLGSQGFFISLEESDGILGKYFNSFGDIINKIQNSGEKSCDEIIALNESLTKENDQLKREIKELTKKPPVIPIEEENGENYFRYPVDYIAISVPFSPPEHYAVDFGWSSSNGGQTQSIYSAFSGTVDMAGFYTGGAGNMVRIYFDDKENNCRWYGIYKHLSKINVKNGDEIILGSKIGNMGSTGDASGNHLHFDLIRTSYGSSYTQTSSSRAKYSVDPIKYLYAYPEQVVGNVTDGKYDIKRFIES